MKWNTSNRFDVLQDNDGSNELTGATDADGGLVVGHGGGTTGRQGVAAGQSKGSGQNDGRRLNSVGPGQTMRSNSEPAGQSVRPKQPAAGQNKKSNEAAFFV